MPETAPEQPMAAFLAAVSEFFAPGGQLARSKESYEPRPGQLTLAQKIGEVLLSQESLLAEAGTGTGKTLAYLVPALLSRLKVVVSTATKQLQEQILGLDVPSIEAALGRRFDVVVMKGRQNYLCEARAEQTLTELGLAGEADALWVQALGRWRQETETGERSEFTALGDDSPQWRRLTASREQCTGRACHFFDRCWVVRMRRRAAQADLVVVNHHLFFADAALGQRGPAPMPGALSLLPPFEAVVFDEAHELDDIATQHFGHGLSEGQLTELLAEVGRLQEATATLPDFTPLLARTRGFVAELYDTLPGGGRMLLQIASPEAHATRRAAHARIDDALAYLEAELGAHADETSRQLGERVADAARTLATVLGQEPRAGLLRDESMALLRPAATTAQAQASRSFEGDEADGQQASLERGVAVGGGRSIGRDGANEEELSVECDGANGEELPVARDGTDSQELSLERDEAVADTPASAQDAHAPQRGGIAYGAGMAPEQETLVRFGEVSASGRLLAARPIEVSARMQQAFGATPSIFVSATLQVNGDFAHIQRRLGLENVQTLAQESAFDFARQVMLYVPDDLAEPEHDRSGEAAAARAVALCEASGGGAFVLCTSHRSMANMARRLQAKFSGPLLVQGSAPKAHLLRTFARRHDAVLLATLGFWRGVDVPGPALRLVIMDRIPFAVPTDPLVQARIAALGAEGLDPFMHYQLPQAALLLRQGFGRLIRRAEDTGVVAILDRRLLSRRYGERLLEALPVCPRVHSFEEAAARLQQNCL